MTILVVIEEKNIHLSSEEQFLASAANSREKLSNQFQSQINSKSYQYRHKASLQIHEDTLKRMVVKYSEQLVYRPLEEIQYWFAYSSGAFIEPGYPPLFYSRDENKKVSPNKSAVAAIGEGIAGFLAQRLYGCRKLARPNHDYPDIVMEGSGKTYLVESKATLASSSSDIKKVVADELIRMAAYTASCTQLDPRPVIGMLVGTVLESEAHYQCYITKVTV